VLQQNIKTQMNSTARSLSQEKAAGF
jgi:hypothetical protein